MPSQAEPISLQLYSLKQQCEADSPQQAVALARHLGFHRVELAGYYEFSVEKWQKLLKNNDLTLSSAHVRIEHLEQEFEFHAEFNAALGNRHLIVPIPAEGEGRARFEDTARRLNQIGERAKAENLRISYHNHHWEFEALEGGGCGMDVLLAETDPELVGFQVDTAWAMAGGGNLMEFLEANSPRVSCLHAKEFQLADRSEPTMGQGDVPFPEVVVMALDQDWPITVEHEPGEDAPAECGKSLECLNGLLAEGGKS